jgi:hypothetical protein
MASTRVEDSPVSDPIFSPPLGSHPLILPVFFLSWQTNPLTCEVLVVDEASMVDIVLMSRLLEAVKPTTKVPPIHLKLLQENTHHSFAFPVPTVFGPPPSSLPLTWHLSNYRSSWWVTWTSCPP